MFQTCVRFCLCLVCPSAVAVIQSIPIFNDTKFLSIPLPEVLGSSLSFSYILQLYLLLMFLGESFHFENCTALTCAILVQLTATWSYFCAQALTCNLLLHALQDFSATSVIFTSRGGDVSEWKREKPIEMLMEEMKCAAFSRTPSVYCFLLSI